MRKFVLFLIFLVLSIKYGVDWIYSKDFQTYADRTKAPWTCTVENIMGGFYLTKSEYATAQMYYSHVTNRCPKTPIAENAMFRMAECMQKTSRANEVILVYEKFLKDFPNSPQAKIAQMEIDRLSVH